MALTAKERKLLRYMTTKMLPPPLQKQVILEMERVNALTDEQAREEMLPFQTTELMKIDKAIADISTRVTDLTTAKEAITAVTITPII